MSVRFGRRDALALLGAAPLVACSRPSRPDGAPEVAPSAPPPRPAAGRLPVIFAAHGAPILLDDAAWVGELARWAAALPRPRAVLVVSAHWTEAPITLGATHPVPLVYDFDGFEPRHYQVTYAAPGAPELAARVRGLLGGKVAASDRGLDHGAYVPLVAMYPRADVPVLQLSMPGLDPAALVGLGRALAPLRDEGVLVFGSGFVTHNMRYAFRPGTPAWAREFDAWVADALVRLDLDALVDFRARAPGARQALPTWEHYAPLLVAAGATGGTAKVSFPISGWWMDGAFSRRSVELG